MRQAERKMQIFIDSADAKELAKLAETGLVDGVTTNPSLVAKSGGNFFETERLYETARLASGATAQVVCDRLLEAITAHRGPAPQADDVTLVAVHAH